MVRLEQSFCLLVRLGSWLCENALTEALRRRDFGKVAMHGHFSKISGFLSGRAPDADSGHLGRLCNWRRKHVFEDYALIPTATCTLSPTTPEPRPLVAIERESGSVSEICWSGEASICFSIAARRCISLSSFASFSLSRVVLSASVSEGSCRSAVSSWLRYRATLSSSCARRRSTLARVKFRSRLFTALNLLPSMATLAFVRSPISRQSSTKRAHTLRIAGPLSLRKSAIVL